MDGEDGAIRLVEGTDVIGIVLQQIAGKPEDAVRRVANLIVGRPASGSTNTSP